MTPILSAAGDLAMTRTLAEKPLLALDFDGTLAPIVSDPSMARTSGEIARLLSLLGDHLQVAIVTGRSVADVGGRLGFSPQFIVGNHGAEGLPGTAVKPLEVSIWRERIMTDFKAGLEAAGVMIEDKGYSMSMHYRHALDREAARDLIHATIMALAPAPRVIGGKCVVNLLPSGASDKFHAVNSLLRISGCRSVIFAGDDVTDDVVFEQAPDDWLTVRVEEISNSRARFCLAVQAEMVIFLRRLLDFAVLATDSRAARNPQG
jgi:trehalose 6-phosphate phosphatase